MIDSFQGIPVKRSSRRKRLSISVKRDGTVEFLAPERVTQEQLAKAWTTFEPWVKRKLAQLAAVPEADKPHQFEFKPGNVFFFCGEALKLEFRPELAPSTIIRYTPDGHLETPSDEPEAIKVMLENFYRRQARRLVTGLVEKYSSRFNIPVNSVSINGARRRFGSCSSAGDLNFSWHLAMYPLELIELVVCHELAHRREMNHSRNFYNVLAELLPDHRERDRELKRWITKLALYPA